MNERIESLNVDLALVTESMTLVCECGDIACAEQFTMSLPDYKALRNESTHFAVKPGHEVADVEDVVRKTDVFWVVRKRPGGPAEIAEALDPRSP